MIEQMYCNGEERVAYGKDSPEFLAIVAQLKERFENVNPASWLSVSTPQYNPIYDDEIVSVVFSGKPAYLDSLNPSSTGRKFFLNKGWVFDKIYTFIRPQQCPLPLPPGGKGMYLGQLVNVYGQPGDENLARYKCVYFMHQDHGAVETWCNQTLPQGTYSTFYAATFDTEDSNKLLRIKSYVYNDSTVFADWELVYLSDCKKNGCLDEVV